MPLTQAAEIVAPSVTGRHPKTFTEADMSKPYKNNSLPRSYWNRLFGHALIRGRL